MHEAGDVPDVCLHEDFDVKAVKRGIDPLFVLTVFVAGLIALAIMLADELTN